MDGSWRSRNRDVGRPVTKQPSRELEQITRALISNPNIVQQLNKNNSPHLSEYKATIKVKSGF